MTKRPTGTNPTGMNPTGAAPAGIANHETRRQADLARRRARHGLGPTILGQRLDEPEWRGHWRSLKFL